MPLLSIKTPAAGIFGKARNEIANVSGWRTEAVPGVEQFEADFVSYLLRLESSGRVCTPAAGHERKQLSHS